MDYTTKARFYAEIGSKLTTGSSSDALVGQFITAASRAIDRYCTGAPDAVDYFKREDVAAEQLQAQIDNHKRLVCYPRKPIIHSVSAFSFRQTPVEISTVVDPALVIPNGFMVMAYPPNVKFGYPGPCWVTISYNGGLGTLSDSAYTIPDDLVDVTTLLAIRFYREAESGLTDAIGVAELAQMVYTKAWPTRVIEMLQPYKRFVGWRFAA